MSRLFSQRKLSKSPPPPQLISSCLRLPTLKKTHTQKQNNDNDVNKRVSSLSGTYATFETYANDGPDHLGFAQNALHRYRLTFIANDHDHQSHEAQIFGSRGFGVLKNREVVGWMVQATFFFENPRKMCLIWAGRTV